MDRTDAPITAIHPPRPARTTQLGNALRHTAAFALAHTVSTFVWAASAAVGIVAMALLPHSTNGASVLASSLAVLAAYGFNTAAFMVTATRIPGLGQSADDVLATYAARVYGDASASATAGYLPTWGVYVWHDGAPAELTTAHDLSIAEHQRDIYRTQGYPNAFTALTREVTR